MHIIKYFYVVGSSHLAAPFKKTLSLEFTDFRDFPEPPTIFKDFPVLENATLKFKYFPGIPGPVPTL